MDHLLLDKKIVRDDPVTLLSRTELHLIPQARGSLLVWTLTLTWRLGWKGKTKGRAAIREFLQLSWREMKEVGTSAQSKAWRELSESSGETE